ncbi:MAG: D-alanyl-D-alanine carboxypeptidase [Gammaproteobacteria bacterium]|nr:D-alanyl-D-alanine carboxypeptidase [Gammaproteobacteria bacterium]
MKRLLAASFTLAVCQNALAFVPAPPAIDGTSYVLMDYASGDILASKDPQARVAPASITKVMTVYIAFDLMKKGQLHADDPVLISERAWRTGLDSSASRMFVKVGSQVPVAELLKGIVIQSGNDAAIALAQHIAGSERAFAELMNQYAVKLGMAHTHFDNATGLPDPDHYTTAHDLAILARALIHDFPERYKLFAEKDYTYNQIHQLNRNQLLFEDPSVDGIKTGFTDAAGYCLMASALRSDRRLISVVMGTKSEKYRASANESLLNYGFRFFETDRLLGAGSPALQARVYKGAVENVAVGTQEPVYLGIARGSRDQLKLVPQLQSTLVAPISAGQRVGEATITLDGKPVKQVPLEALQAVPQGGLWRRMVDQIRLWLED